MSLSNHKITTYADNVKSLADYPSDNGITAAQLKAIFDGRTDKEVKNSVNGVIDALAATTGAAEIGTSSGSNVQVELNNKVSSIAGKGLSANDYTNAEKAKLSGVQEGATKVEASGGKLKINGLSTAIDVTSDADKPVSTAQQAALNGKVSIVSGKGLSSNDYTSAEKSKLSGIAAAATKVEVANGKLTINGVATEMDATSDANKPISTAQQAALDAKLAKRDPVANGNTIKVNDDDMHNAFGFHADYAKNEVMMGVTTDRGVPIYDAEIGVSPSGVRHITPNGSYKLYSENFKPTKSDVGLGNVENITPDNMPVSIAQQAAINAKLPIQNPIANNMLSVANANNPLYITDISASQAGARVAFSSTSANPPTLVINSNGLSFEQGGSAYRQYGENAAPCNLYAANLVVNGDFRYGINGWFSNGNANELSASDGILTTTVKLIATSGGVSQEVSSVSTHKYYASFFIKPFRTHKPLIYIGQTYSEATQEAVSGSWTRVSFCLTPAVDGTVVNFYDNGNRTTDKTIGSITQFKQFLLLDLTATFGEYANLITTPEQAERALFAKFGEKYFNGRQNIWSAKSETMRYLALDNAKADKAQEEWITPTLVGGFTSSATQPVKYFKDQFGIVHLVGKLENGTPNVTAFTFLPGYRPKAPQSFPSTNVAATILRLMIQEDGVLKYFNTSTDVYLNGISFLADQ